MNFDYYKYIVFLFGFFLLCNIGKSIVVICYGVWMFCLVKILKGKKLICFVVIKDDVENVG